MTDSGPLPWQSDHWLRLCARLAEGSLPHGLLLTGARGLGKSRFALALARAALCEQADAERGACGQCRSCHLFDSGTHPDHHLVTLEYDEKKKRQYKEIRVDQVRELSAALNLASQFGGYRTAIIEPADRMNVNAANSLLKTLEEPGAATLMILVTDRPASLPATIRSRCQVLAFAIPERAQALAWMRQQAPGRDHELALAHAGGAPLRALEMEQGNGMQERGNAFTAFAAMLEGKGDPVALAGAWLKQEPDDPLSWLESWVQDMIRIRTAPGGNLENPDLAPRLQALGASIDLQDLFAHLDRITEARRLCTGSEVNPQMLLESVLVPWAPGGPR
jgi:DNA polymerase-3 subunit delta'